MDSSKVMIGTSEYTRQTEGCSYAGAEVATFIDRGEGYVVVSWTADYENYYDTYEQILSTFQFLTDTSDWQTNSYEGNYTSFSIKYPSEGEVMKEDTIFDPIITTGIDNCIFKYNDAGLGRGSVYDPLDSI